MTDLEMAKQIALTVQQENGRTFFVGGYVRDKLLGKNNKDIDIEIYGITPDKLKTILSSLGEVQTIGESFGILNLKGYSLDIAQPRTETATGRGHKDFEVYVDPFASFEKAAGRRDFTINAIMEDVLTGEIVDCFNGQQDLKDKIIRHVKPDAFIEDPLRVLRAAQFASRFNFKICDETKQLASQMDLSNLSKERIAGELTKALLKSEKPSIFFDTLKEMGHLDTWFPEIKALIDVPQSQKHHPEGDVYNHTMLCLNEAAMLKNKSSNPLWFMISTLTHDFGKPEATEWNPKKETYTSYGHDTKGKESAKKFVERIYNDKDMAKYVENMAEFHMKPKLLYNQNSSDKSFMKMFDKILYPEDLLLLVRCDAYGRAIDRDTIVQKEQICNNYLHEKLSQYKELIIQPHITGKDLIEFGFEPGPKFSEMLEFTHKLHLSGLDKEKVTRELLGKYHPPIQSLEKQKAYATNKHNEKMSLKPKRDTEILH